MGLCYSNKYDVHISEDDKLYWEKPYINYNYASATNTILYLQEAMLLFLVVTCNVFVCLLREMNYLNEYICLFELFLQQWLSSGATCTTYYYVWFYAD